MGCASVACSSSFLKDSDASSLSTWMRQKKREERRLREKSQLLCGKEMKLKFLAFLVNRANDWWMGPFMGMLKAKLKPRCKMLSKQVLRARISFYDRPYLQVNTDTACINSALRMVWLFYLPTHSHKNYRQLGFNSKCTIKFNYTPFSLPHTHPKLAS